MTKPADRKAITDKERLDWLSARKSNKPGKGLYFPHCVERQSDQTWAAWDGNDWHWGLKNPRAAIDAALSKRRVKEAK